MGGSSKLQGCQKSFFSLSRPVLCQNTAMCSLNVRGGILLYAKDRSARWKPEPPPGPLPLAHCTPTHGSNGTQPLPVSGCQDPDFVGEGCCGVSDPRPAALPLVDPRAIAFAHYPLPPPPSPRLSSRPLPEGMGNFFFTQGRSLEDRSLSTGPANGRSRAGLQFFFEFIQQSKHVFFDVLVF